MSTHRKTLTKLGYASALASVALVSSLAIVYVLFSFQHQEMRGYIVQVAFWVTLVVSMPICIYESNQHFNLQQARDRLAEQGRQLAEARDEALRAHEAKSQFLAKMSHEIRTPMNGVIGLASLLRESVSDARQREMVDVIVTSGDSLVRLIDDILDFSRLEAGKMQFERHAFDVAEILEDVAALIALPAWKKGVALNVWCDPDLPTQIVGDAGRLRQIVTNLIGNAVKFTERGSIDLALYGVVEGDQLAMTLSVKDTGCGIPEDKLAAIFEKFEQVDNSHARRFGGAGLGLAITKELVEAMGGSVSVTSRVGAGSEFRVALKAPLDPARGPAAQPLAGRRVGLALGDALSMRTAERYLRAAGAVVFPMDRAAGGESGACDVVVADVASANLAAMTPGDGVALVVVVAPDQSAAPTDGVALALARPIRRRALVAAVEQAAGETARSARESRPSTPASLRRRVLVAEDNPVNQMVIGVMLERLGCSCVFVSDGLAAAETAKDGFDVILMDISMPRLSGEDATRLIRARQAAGGGRTPIIAVTAHAAAGTDPGLVDAGIDDVLVKPIRLDALAALLDKWTGNAAERTEGRVSWKS